MPEPIIEFKADEWRAAAGRATKAGLQEIGKIIAADWRRNAPRAAQHRVDRVYPSGYRYGKGGRGEEPRLSKSIYSRVQKESKSGALVGFVRSRVGYSGYQEKGWKPKLRGGRQGARVVGRFDARKALERNASKMLPLLARGFDRETSKIDLKSLRKG